MTEFVPPRPPIGHFAIEAEVGHGSTGIVYRAHDLTSGRTVALKVLVQHIDLDASAHVRFERAASAVAKLRHPHIAQVHEFGNQAHELYLASQWVPGRSLEALLKESGPWPLERALRLFDQLAEALDYAHDHGVIHYDIKPANILVDDQDHAVIVDFELAWLSDAPASTNAGMIFGTPRYMAPEQIRGDALGHQADLYSLAAVLYEVLSGQPPFGGDSTPALLYHHLYTAPPPITEVVPTLPAAVEAALLRAMAKQPSQRFKTAREMGAALRSHPPLGLSRRVLASLLRPTFAFAPTLTAANPAWPRRALEWAAAVGLVLTALLVPGAYFAFRWRPVPLTTTLTPSSLAPPAAQATFTPTTVSPATVGRSTLQTPTPSVSSPKAAGKLLTQTPTARGAPQKPLPAGSLVALPLALTPAPTQSVSPSPDLDDLLTVTSQASPTQTPSVPPATPTVTQAPATLTSSLAATATSAPPSATPALVPTQTLPASPTASLPSPTLTSSPTASATSVPITAPIDTPTVAPTQTATPSQPPPTVTVVPSVTPSDTVAPSMTSTPGPTPGGRWTMPGGNATYSNFVAEGLPLLASQVIWHSFQLPSPIASLVVGDGLVVVSTAGPMVYAFNSATGATAWTVTLGGDLAGALTLAYTADNQALVLAPSAAGLEALNLANGLPLWTLSTDTLQGHLQTSLAIHANGTAYLLTQNGWLHAIDPAHGSLVWSFHLADWEGSSLPPALSGTTALLIDSERTLLAFDLKARSLLWKIPLPGKPATPPCILAAQGLVSLGLQGGGIQTFRLTDGTPLWAATTGQTPTGLANDGQQIYAASANGTVAAWMAATGATRWTVQLEDPVRNAPLTDGQWVLVTTRSGHVRYFAAADGREDVARRLSLPAALNLAAVPAGQWLFAPGTNTVYGVGP